MIPPSNSIGRELDRYVYYHFWKGLPPLYFKRGRDEWIYWEWPLAFPIFEKENGLEPSFKLSWDYILCMLGMCLNQWRTLWSRRDGSQSGKGMNSFVQLTVDWLEELMGVWWDSDDGEEGVEWVGWTNQ